MLNNEVYTAIVDSDKILPFQLQIHVGGGERTEIVSLNKVSESVANMLNCIYEIQELKPLRLILYTNQDVSVTFVWNKVYDGKKQGLDNCYHLNRKQNQILLYEHGKTEHVYPWRCGLYHFEIRIGEKTYLAAIKIVPKNFNDVQLSLIQNTVRSVWNNLLLDRGQYKKTFRIFTDIEDSSYMKTIRLLLKRIPMIKKHILTVEKIDSFTAIYQYNYSSRKPNSRTIRKNEKMPIQKDGKLWNRMFTTRQSLPHHYVKYKLVGFLSQIQHMARFLEDTIKKLEQEMDMRIREKQALQTIMQSIEKNGSVTEREKQKYRNLYLVKDTERKKLNVNKQEYRMIYSFVNEFLIYMKNRLQLPFWDNMKMTHANSFFNLPIPFRQCLNLLELKDGHIQEYTPSFLLVYKPTFLIYEYYVYVSLLFLLQEIGFVATRPILEQIQTYFYMDGLQDGTIVELHYNEKMVKIVYNELIETHPLIALSKNSNFYNGEDTKKPDIRLDYYEMEEGKWNFQSTIIIEVKYSPMYNIFQPVGNTKATEQMYKYWAIKYVHEEQGKLYYQRRAIHEVVCVYPGSQVHPKKIESGCGIFLQFYPYKTNQEEVRIKGKYEMMELLKRWLALG